MRCLVGVGAAPERAARRRVARARRARAGLASPRTRRASAPACSAMNSLLSSMSAWLAHGRDRARRRSAASGSAASKTSSSGRGSAALGEGVDAAARLLLGRRSGPSPRPGATCPASASRASCGKKPGPPRSGSETSRRDALSSAVAQRPRPRAGAGSGARAARCPGRLGRASSSAARRAAVGRGRAGLSRCSALRLQPPSHELARQPVEQLRVRRRLAVAAEVVGRGARCPRPKWCCQMRLTDDARRQRVRLGEAIHSRQRAAPAGARAAARAARTAAAGAGLGVARGTARAGSAAARPRAGRRSRRPRTSTCVGGGVRPGLAHARAPSRGRRGRTSSPAVAALLQQARSSCRCSTTISRRSTSARRSCARRGGCRTLRSSGGSAGARSPRARGPGCGSSSDGSRAARAGARPRSPGLRSQRQRGFARGARAPRRRLAPVAGRAASAWASRASTSAARSGRTLRTKASSA